MTVKDFQMKYVFNHHTVVYDQYLLTSAIEHTAYKLFGEETKKEYEEESDAVSAAANKLCSVESMLQPLPLGNLKLINPSDGDFICLMKQDDDNKNFKEWYSRKYSRFAIWKTPDEFAGFFKIKRNQSIENSNFGKEVISALKENGIAVEDILIKKATYKPKVLLKSLYILVHKELKRFTEIYPKEGATEDVVFYYVYVTKPNQNQKEIEELRQRLITVLLPVMQKLYPELYHQH